MGSHIWHVVLSLYIFIDFEANALTSSDVQYVDNNYTSKTFDNITIISNNQLVLQCPQSDDVQWKVLNETWKSLQTYSDTLEFNPVTLQDAGLYACFINGDTLVKRFNVTVFEAPHFLKKMQKLVVKPVGNRFRLNCKAGGYPTPNITWFSKDKIPPTRTMGAIKINHWSLSREESTLDDKGNYTCVVCNIVGCINFTFVVDVVEGWPSKPYIKEGYPQNLTVLKYTNATFECPQVIVDLEVYIQWFRIDNQIEVFDENSKTNWTAQKTDDGNTNQEIYIIPKVTHDDEGWYACFVSSSLGTASSKGYLHVVDEESVCGELSSLALLTMNGKSPEVGKYPWVTAIYQKEETAFEHFCGGSILTARFVLTAAHCVSNGNGNPLDPEKIKLAAGKYYNKYNDVKAIFAQYRNVQKVLIHPSYKGNSRRYSSDIALLLATDFFAFSEVVQPVCYRNLPHVYLTDESTGIIAGWGYTTAGQGPSDELKEISVPFKTNTTCQSSLSPDWMDVYNGYDKFCAGRYNDSIEICKGDSGNGLVFRNSQDGRFYIHGIVSVEWKLNTIACDKQLSTLYTRVAVHYDWLEQMIADNS